MDDGYVAAVIFGFLILDYIILLRGLRHQGHLFWWRFNGKRHRVILAITILCKVVVKSVFYFKEVVLKLLAHYCFVDEADSALSAKQWKSHRD